MTHKYIAGTQKIGTEIFTVLEEIIGNIKESQFDEKVIESPHTEAIILKQQQYPRLHLGAKTTRDELFSTSELRETWFNSNQDLVNEKLEFHRSCETLKLSEAAFSKRSSTARGVNQ